MQRADRAQLMEVMLARIYSAIVRPGDCVIDGGAYGGMHTIPLARLVRPGGAVVAYEPTAAINDLERWLEDEGLRGAVVLRQAALSDSTGSKKFYIHKENPALSSLAMPGNSDEVERITVAATRLDDEPILGRVSFIKLDLEGGEFPWLRGARRILAVDAPTVVFENGRAASAAQFGYSRDEFFALFREFAYQITDICGRRLDSQTWLDPGLAWYFVARRPSAPKLDLVAIAKALLLELDATGYVFSGWEGAVSSVVENGRLPAQN
jgi:FkbM family methyltransferase